VSGEEDLPTTVAPSRPGLSRRRFLETGAGAVAAQLLTGCGLLSTQPDAHNRLTARPIAPTVPPVRGLQRLGFGSTRDGNLYVPNSYSPGTPAPLFVALHGAGGSCYDWGSYYARAEEGAMVFLATDSRSATWDMILGSFGPDVAFLNRALGYTFARCRIDPSRIALGGFSDGASYALSLGVSNGDLFTHLVAHSPGFCHPQRPIKGRPLVYASHGTQDGVLPVESTRLSIVPGLREDGYDVTYHEFAGGHQIPPEISDEAVAWFLGAG